MGYGIGMGCAVSIMGKKQIAPQMERGERCRLLYYRLNTLKDQASLTPVLLCACMEYKY